MVKSEPETEQERLNALLHLNLLDTPASESFDRITRMAARIFDLPIAAVSLTDKDRQWFKSRFGLDHSSIPRDKAPCAEVAESTRCVLLPDLLDDPYYADSLLARNGTRFYAGAPLVTRDGHGLGALCVLGLEPREATEAEMAALRDLAAMVMSQIELQHALGRIDPVSGLPNRVQMLEDLADLNRDDVGEQRIAVLVDLARPEQLNSGMRVLGTAYLDSLVTKAVTLLRAAVGPAETIYHVAATQSAFVAPRGITKGEYLPPLEKRLVAESNDWNAQLIASLSIGVAPFVTGHSVAEDVIRSAYGAAMDARVQRTRIGIYSAANDRLHQRQYKLMQDIEHAFDDPEQLRLVMQPRIAVATRRCVGAEGLIRWRHPELGDIAPIDFIPLVEHSSFARKLTDWVLRQGTNEIGVWQRMGLEIQLSLNIFAANLDEPDFAQRVLLYMMKHHVRPDRLELEVTEGAALANTSQSQLQLGILRESGVRVAIDDFGTGYSSLAYLQSLPASVVKIDQSFIKDIVRDDRAAALVGQIIALAGCLDYRVVAEGVEEEEALVRLQEMGCNEAQGFHLSRPLERADFIAWLRPAEPAEHRAVA